jgi:asparagine synthase (glutamine-hydrolysing)
MCGLVGIFSLGTAHSRYVNDSTIQNMNNTIIHRGPDDSGVYLDDGVALGSRRLSILDLSPNGHMPMLTGNGQYCIAYNGEVYNYGELRSKFLQGESFHSNTDTEVILRSYIKYGAECLHSFNGMFAFALYDKEQKNLTIVRDRLGIKPLFYTVYDGHIFFASEMKALWAAGVPKEFDDDRFEELLAFRYVAGENTVYKNVKRLLPGHYMEIINGKIQINKWWGLDDAVEKSRKAPVTDEVNWYKKTFDDSVRLRTISDVPVGVLLSGGLDSSSVAASLGQNKSNHLSSFTVRFQESGYDEGDLAKLVADKYNFDFNQLYIDRNKLFEKTREVLKYNDEPVFHASDIFVREIALFAKKKVTVLLSGEGGDETLGGYVRYQPLKYAPFLKAGFNFSSLLKYLPLKHPRWRKLIRMLSLKSLDKFIIYNSSEVLPKDLKKLGVKPGPGFAYREEVLQKAKKAYHGDPMRQAMFYDMHTHLCSLLDRNDLMTMGASIECRVPFLDFRLVEGLAGLPTVKIVRNKVPKGLLRDALGDRLPPEILRAHKWGFGVPWDKYYRAEGSFRNYISRLYEHRIVKKHFEDTNRIKQVIEDFMNGDGTYGPFINQLFNICLWYDTNFAS